MFECPKCRKELPDGAAWCCWCGAKLVTTRKPRARSNGEGSVYQYGNAGKWRAEGVAQHDAQAFAPGCTNALRDGDGTVQIGLAGTGGPGLDVPAVIAVV